MTFEGPVPASGPSVVEVLAAWLSFGLIVGTLGCVTAAVVHRRRARHFARSARSAPRAK